MLAVKGKVECVDGIMRPERFLDGRKAPGAILSDAVERKEHIRAGA